MQLFFGYPFETGHFPFLMHVPLSGRHFVFSGSTSKTDVERVLLVLEAADYSQLSQRIRADFVEVSLSRGLWLLDAIFETIQSEEYTELRACALSGVEEVELPEFNIATASATMGLMNPKSGCFFGLSEDNLSDGLKAIRVAKKNPVEQQQRILDAAIETVADIAVTPLNRPIWAHAMIAISLVAKSLGHHDLERVALQNAAGFVAQRNGSEIPFVKDWVSHQLLSGVAIARMVSKFESSAKDG